MRANELRIGNTVGLKGHTLDENNIVHHEIFQVSIASLCEDGTVELKIVVNGKELRALHKETELVPIPLAEELLLKCGFILARESDMNQHYYAHGDVILVPREGDTLFKPCLLEDPSGSNLDRWFCPYSCPISSLHQLQNLIFALTGEELEVKL